MVKVLDLGEVPLAGAFLREDQFAEERFYPLEVQFCVDCTLVQVNKPRAYRPMPWTPCCNTVGPATSVN